MTTVVSALDFRLVPAGNGAVSPDGSGFYRRVLGEQGAVFMSRNIASGEEKEIARGDSLGGEPVPGRQVDLHGGRRSEPGNSRMLLLIPAAGGMRGLMATPSAVPETELTNQRRGARLAFAAWGRMQWVLATRHMADPSQADELWRVFRSTRARRERSKWNAARGFPSPPGHLLLPTARILPSPLRRPRRPISPRFGHWRTSCREAEASDAAACRIGDSSLGLDLYLPAPEENPLTTERIELGRRLFFDRRLSRDGSIACASCHDPQRAYSDGHPIAIGVLGAVVVRNARR